MNNNKLYSKEMKQLAFKMRFNEVQKEAYKKRHSKLWSELKQLLKENGVNEYSIFLDKVFYLA